MSLDRKALVVDDDGGIRLLLKHILIRKGFSVDLARDGAEAIEKIVQHDYDVIVLDVMMPRIDGKAVVKFLSKHSPHILTRVVAMTAFGSAALEDVCPPLTRHVEKPFDIEHLMREVTRGESQSEANIS